MKRQGDFKAQYVLFVFQNEDYSRHKLGQKDENINERLYYFYVEHTAYTLKAQLHLYFIFL